MKNNIILTIAKKDFFSFINSPIAYTIIVPFLLLSFFIYTQSAFISGEASLRPYFELLPWFLLLLAPAISMKSLTDEQKSETLELLFAHPISELQIVLGKFLGALLFYLVILFTTISLPLTLIFYSRPDIGQIIGQYIGALLIGATFISIGIASSAYVKNAISSFLLGASISFAFIIIGLEFVTRLFPYPINLFVSELSILVHVDNIARGLLDIRDIAYFITVTGIFLAITVIKLSERKTSENKMELAKLRFSLLLIFAIGVIVNILLSYYPLRLDITQDRLFTLSKGTEQTLKNIPDIVNITIYRSRELPAQMNIVAREVDDLMKDYQKISPNIKVKVVYPDENPDLQSDASEAGIQEVQFNKIGSGKFEVQSGMLGIGIRYGDKTESIPFVSDTSDLEYQLTRRINKITNKENKKIGIIQTGFNQNQILDKILETQYETKTYKEGDTFSTRDISELIVIDDGLSESTVSANLQKYLKQGGHALVLASGVAINKQALTAEESKSEILTSLKDYGLIINKDLVYDLQLSETLAFTGENGERYLSPYPYWLKALPATDKFLPLSTIKSIGLGWASSLKLESKKGVTQTKLLTTGEAAGRVTQNFDISPKSIDILTPKQKDILLAAALEKDDTRIVVVGTSTLASDQFLQNYRDDIAFLSNTIDYLSTDKDVSTIPSKGGERVVFEFNSPTDLYIAQFGNLLIPPILVILFGIIYLRRRKIRTRRVYDK